MADWTLTLKCLDDVSVRRAQWLIRTLQSDPHVQGVEVWEGPATIPHRGLDVRISVTFIEGQDCPRGSTLHSLDHTHGSKITEVTPPPKTWLERLLSGV